MNKLGATWKMLCVLACLVELLLLLSSTEGYRVGIQRQWGGWQKQAHLVWNDRLCKVLWCIWASPVWPWWKCTSPQKIQEFSRGHVDLVASLFAAVQVHMQSAAKTAQNWPTPWLYVLSFERAHYWRNQECWVILVIFQTKMSKIFPASWISFYALYSHTWHSGRYQYN